MDSCCIDKTSSADLSEAINSMFRYYANAAKCYVYLSDVPTIKTRQDNVLCDEWNTQWKPDFHRSRWFTRGWTLQELIAPLTVEFYSKEWDHLGEKRELSATISQITSIPVAALKGAPLSGFEVEERLSWSAGRQTKREEDSAYSLLGLFGVFMPLIYGEGSHATKRLRQAIQEDEEKAGRNLKESLRYEQISSRQTTIKDPHNETCQWLLCQSEYLDWLDATKVDHHHGMLWIKGNPGTGKSTIMKFAHQSARTQLERSLGTSSLAHNPGNAGVVLAFFFNARGAIMEKSILGLYRSFLVQLLEQPACLRKVLCLLPFSPRELSRDYQWNIGLLQELLKKAILSVKRPVTCFIDALDECDEQQIRDMISFFGQIGDLAASANIRFQTCFASRHYPHITMAHGIELVLERQEGHTQDIAEYLRTELKIGHNNTAQQIRQEVQSRASGIFMWVVLAVGILNKVYDSGRIHALRRRLKEIPDDLHALFRDILTRDSNNKEELVLCIEWLLFAVRPLSPQELYYAILAGTEPDAVLEWDLNEISYDTFRRFVLDASKGLAQISVSAMPRVQFIHESVRDFLLKGKRLDDIWPDMGADFQRRLHGRLARCCQNYMTFGMAACGEGLEEPPFAQPHFEPQFSIASRSRYPFLEYSVRNLSYHSTTSGNHDISENGTILHGRLHVQRVSFDIVSEQAHPYQQRHCMSTTYILVSFPTSSAAIYFARLTDGSNEIIRVFLSGTHAAKIR